VVRAAVRAPRRASDGRTEANDRSVSDDEAIASEVPRGREAPRVLNRGNDENHRARFGGEFGEKRKRKKKRVTNSYAQTVTGRGAVEQGGRG